VRRERMQIGVYVMAPPSRTGTNAGALVVGESADPGEVVRTARLRDFAVHAEDVGFDTIWVPDHVVMPVGYASTYPYQPAAADGDFRPYPFDEVPFPEPLTALAYLAGATRRIRLAAGVVILPERNPVLFAKQLATLDALSGGRLEMGVGLGWLREEYAALGVPWANRGRRMDEYIEVMRRLWQPGTAEFHGTYVDFDELRCDPKPVQPGGVPLIVGGHSSAAAARAGRLGNGFLPSPLGGSGDVRPLVDQMRAAAEAAGRDPADVALYQGCAPDLAMVEEAAADGAAAVFLAVFPADLDSGLRWLDDVAEAVLARRP
jgi:probable F420-dependent oxidoreductase